MDTPVLEEVNRSSPPAWGCTVAGVAVGIVGFIVRAIASNGLRRKMLVHHAGLRTRCGE